MDKSVEKQRFRSIKEKLRSITTVHGVCHVSGAAGTEGAAKTDGAAGTEGAGVGGRSEAAWALLLLGNLALTAAFLTVVKQHYNTDQIVTKMNANCKTQEVPFPAVSICNFNIVSLRESRNIFNLLKKNKRSEEDITMFLKSTAYLKDYEKLHVNVSNLMETLSILKQNYYAIDSIMEEVHQKCENLLLECSFNRKSFDCSEMFRLTKTFEGYCCVFNFAALPDVDHEEYSPKLATTEWEYYSDPSDGLLTNIISTSQFGRSSGLSVIFNIEPDDYPSWSTTRHFGAKILVSDPNDFPETTVMTNLVAVGQSVELKLQPAVFQSEASLRRVAPAHRACWFHDEVQLTTSPRYSFETCRTECTMTGYKRLCGCLPYKYPQEKSTPVCEFNDMPCLLNITALGIRELVSCPVMCYAECVDKKYFVTSDVVPLTAADMPTLAGVHANTSSLAAVRVYFKKSTCKCYKLTMIMDFNYFIATYGGVFSLSFGGSLMTVCEVAYLALSTLFDAARANILKLYYKLITPKFGYMP